MIALALVVGLIDGCPLPPERYVRPWQQPIVDVVRPIQQALMRPFAWVTRVFRVTQRWALFQVAPRDRYRLELWGRHGDRWEVMFRAGDPEHTAYGSLLLDEHLRGAWNPTDRPPGQFGPFAHWFTGKVLDEHPELEAARLQFERIVIEDGTLTGTGAFVMRIERTRGGL